MEGRLSLKCRCIRRIYLALCHFVKVAVSCEPKHVARSTSRKRVLPKLLARRISPPHERWALDCDAFRHFYIRSFPSVLAAPLYDLWPIAHGQSTAAPRPFEWAGCCSVCPGRRLLRPSPLPPLIAPPQVSYVRHYPALLRRHRVAEQVNLGFRERQRTVFPSASANLLVSGYLVG